MQQPTALEYGGFKIKDKHDKEDTEESCGGKPSLKRFLLLRFLLGSWSLFLGLFYGEIFGWSAGILMLSSVLLQMTAIKTPSLWKRCLVPLICLDTVGLALVLFGCCSTMTLIRGIYLGDLFFLLLQLTLQIFIWPGVCFSEFNNTSIRRSKGIKIFPFFFWTGSSVALLVMLVVTSQRFIIYPGSLLNISAPKNMASLSGLDIEKVSFRSVDGVLLRGLFVKPSNADPTIRRPTMWIFYGNSENMYLQLEHIVPRMNRLLPTLQFFIYNYRGYADSQGRANIVGFRRDINAAVKYLQSRRDVDDARIAGYGHSIGGALLSDLLGRHPGFINAAIFSNTFVSMRKMFEALWLHPLKPFITENWDSKAALTKAITIDALPPCLFISSRKDELIPAKQMDELYRIARLSNTCVKVDLSNGTHNDWKDDESVDRFLTELLNII